MKMGLHSFLAFFGQRGIRIFLHLVILVLSIVLIAMISYDSFKNVAFYEAPGFQKWQFWICVIFMAIFFIELFTAPKKWQYFWSHLIFFLVSIPYQVIIYHYGLEISQEVSYLVRYVPLIRGGYALAIVVNWFTYNKATGLFFTYIILLMSLVYFSSLTFYLFEYGVNPLVTKYTDALWWATMDVTTVGCNITAVTGVGRVLSVMLAALGMMLFPIFTVYVTNMVTLRNKESQEASKTTSIIQAYKDFLKAHPQEVDAANKEVEADAAKREAQAKQEESKAQND